MDNLIEAVKKAMQPLITLAAVIVFVVYAFTRAISADEVWFIIKVVFGFWFGYTAIKNFNFNGKETTESSTTPSAIGGIKATERTFAPQNYNPYSAPGPVETCVPTISEAMDKIVGDLEPENSTGLAMKFKDKMNYWWSDLAPAQRKEWLDYAIALAQKAWKDWIGVNIKQEPPTDYRDMEPTQVYFGEIKKACGDKYDPYASRDAADVLHDLLKFQQTGEW